MLRAAVTSALCLTACAASVQAAPTIREIRLADGWNDVNRITAPVYDGSAMLAIESIVSKYDKKARFVRRMGGNMFTKGPEYELDPGVDLAALLSEALRTEAPVMGFRQPADSASAWRLSGTLEDIFLESRQVYMGATLFYGYIDLDLQLVSPTGERHSRRFRLHSYSGSYNAGMGRRDEAEEAAARMLVDGAQEALARINRELIRMPAHQAMGARLEQLSPGGLADRSATIRAVGLSGVSGAGAKLMALIASEPDEDRRSDLIEAVGVVGAPEAVPVLDARYVTEDEDCRWSILKAMDYIGGAEAEHAITARGSRIRMEDREGSPSGLPASGSDLRYDRASVAVNTNSTLPKGPWSPWSRCWTSKPAW